MKLSIRMEPVLEGVGSAHGLFSYTDKLFASQTSPPPVVMELMVLAVLGRDIWEPRY